MPAHQGSNGEFGWTWIGLGPPAIDQAAVEISEKDRVIPVTLPDWPHGPDSTGAISENGRLRAGSRPIRTLDRGLAPDPCFFGALRARRIAGTLTKG